ncbi:helix-turn-helix transcriptional regulator [Wohlfahrtiimonas chitiniclastica]|uniref:helix-turn-helix domain-containing protein n=1 Tax=Wohlfahrtiimonas chitiniclastica TaxID=400946 RepID=UPI001BCDEC1C|nr:helix-turn-helix transcriptional regulator [Wohlfahrtiimonas chitiniclastica]MBS7829176.1 helix-turn-helix transcriptional regulator [Wohlfahrtiimonas chitiniclastica]
MWKFEARLIQEREKSGFSVEAFGAIAGVKKTTQYNYEKGERKPDIEYLYNISKIGCDIKYIVTGEPSLQELTADEIKLLESFRSADLQLKAAAMAVLESGQCSSEMTQSSGGTISFGDNATIGNSMTGGTVQKIDMRKNSDPDKD